MASKEEKIKLKMLNVLERAVEDPHLIDDKEWSRLFGAASLARAMAIVTKLKGEVNDDDDEDYRHEPDEIIRKKSFRQLFDGIHNGDVCKRCEQPWPPYDPYAPDD